MGKFSFHADFKVCDYIEKGYMSCITRPNSKTGPNCIRVSEKVLTEFNCCPFIKV